MSTKSIGNKGNKGEQGVSLMLAVLVLSAVTAIAFSMAAIVLIEIRASRDTLRTEPALYATLGVTEEALFQYKRFYTGSGLNVTSCDSDGTTAGDGDPETDPNGICHLNGVTLSLPGTQPIKFDDSPRVELINSDTTLTLPLYIATSYAQQYDRLTVDVLHDESPPVEVYLVRYPTNGPPECATLGVYPDCIPESINPGTQFVFNSFDPLGQWQYELVLHNGNGEDVSVSIGTRRVGDSQPGGLPFVGEQVLRIVANYLGLTRTYQVRIPIP